MRTLPLFTLALLGPVFLVDCKEEPAATDSGAAAPSAAPPAASSIASAVVDAAPPEPPHDCPAGSTGIGSFAKPCEAKGKDRMMEVSWKGKYDKDGAPSFQVASKSAKAILYGKMAVYFYDKAGTQIDVKQPIENSQKTHAYHTCSGANIFAGAVNPGEKLTMTFSCVKKKDMPEGTVAMEAELQIVGFADSTNKKTDFYWRNNELTPEQRPKGGVK